MNVDDSLKQLGLVGRWQATYYCGLCLGCMVPGGWHIVSIVWTGFKPPHHCKLPTNASMHEWIPREGPSDWASCSMYANASTNQTTPCDAGWHYDESISGPTIVTKWDMVCERAYLVDTAQSIMTFGVLLGSLFFTKLSDALGRKPMLVLSQLSMSLSGALSVLPSHLHLFYTLRFFEGMFQQGVVLCNLVMLCEMFSSQDRALVAIGASAMWGLGNAVLPLVAFVTKDWVSFQLSISLYGFFFIPFFWWLPETVPWLHANNRLEEAEAVLLRAAHMNHITFPRPILRPPHFNESKLCLTAETTAEDEDVESGDIRSKAASKSRKTQKVVVENGRIGPQKDDSVEGCEDIDPNKKDGKCHGNKGVGLENDIVGEKGGRTDWFVRCLKNKMNMKSVASKSSSVEYSIVDLVRSGMLFKHLVLCLLFGMVDNLVYYGLVLSSNSLSGNHYLNGFFNAIIEVPACLLTYLAVSRYGRKGPIAATHVLAGLSLLLCIVANHLIESAVVRSTVVIVLTNMGKFGITGAFAIIFFYVAELFPTNLRNQAVGICVFFARLGGVMASYTAFLMERYPDALAGVFGTVCVLVAVLVVFLPETHNKALPESIDQMHAWSGLTFHENNVSNDQVVKL